MNDEKRSPGFAFPLLVFAASRALLCLFSVAAPIFGPVLGTHPALSRGLLSPSMLWVAMAHGEIASYARIARVGYQSAADVPYFPLAPLAGKALGAMLGSTELGLFILSLLACAAGFVGVYRLAERLRGIEAARCSVALLAAFPFSYHLSDGSALACLLAFTAWGAWLALRGSLIGSATLFALGALAHPLCAVVALATPALFATGLRAPASARRPHRLPYLAPLIPALVVVGWILYLRVHLAAPPAAFWGALLGKGNMLRSPWQAILLSFGAILAIGGLIQTRLRGLRMLALVGGVELGIVIAGWSPTSAFAMAACWPLFLGLGDLLARRQALRLPTLTILTTHQGLLLYCFSHFLGQL